MDNSRQDILPSKQRNIQRKMKEYYQINKQRISEQDKQKIECDCGSIVRKVRYIKAQALQKNIQNI